ncbi:MAG: 23S rRNA (pseudouridine(1915)-N(3))-methyltransferase RlmH [Parvularculaceae bacterium]|nr:23S rRNA (pseudouridine(1915)-N(3))-methyltransferase RlmH [Parvularculaceae bacterium]
MRIVVAAVGRRKATPEGALIDDYAARVAAGGRMIGIASLDLFESDASRAQTVDERRAKEWDELQKFAPDGARRIILDERGAALTSLAFTERIRRWRDDGEPALAFLLGGPDGHPAGAREGADLVLALGPQTWPHLLARAMLCEQIYRATTILAGRPYHRA